MTPTKTIGRALAQEEEKRSGGSGRLLLILGLSIGGGLFCLLLTGGVGIGVAVMLSGKDAYKENEAAAKEAIACLEELATTMESVRDRNTAKAGAQRIHGICDRLERLGARIDKLPKLTPEQDARLKRDTAPQIEAINQRLKRVAFQAGVASQGEPSFLAAALRLQQVGQKLQRLGR